jgi:hypothetical protein
VRRKCTVRKKCTVRRKCTVRNEKGGGLPLWLVRRSFGL